MRAHGIRLLSFQGDYRASNETRTNIDMDVTPPDRRIWGAWTMLGFWLSDALNAQGWQAPAAILAVGLTWREAIVCIIFGNIVTTIPLALNGAVGADLHIPFAVAMRSSCGWYFARFAVIVRMITALFWHAIQTYTGSTAITQCIRAIWPSYLDIPNHLPASAGITSQELLSHFVFWSIQVPFLLTPPHKLKWFFVFKSVIVITSSVAVVITMTSKAGGTGEIWSQEYKVFGETRRWLILSSLSSCTGSWATMATNIPDFTRYLNQPKAIYWQVMFLPAIALLIGMFGIISTSAASVVYGSYIWDPVTLAAQWDGASGRAGAFFVGFSWCVAQIGTNLSANVISCANDLTSLFPKYINIRRGIILTTVTAGWVMVPWKIIYSASSLLSFMSGLGIFLAPIAAILSSDYWLVKRRRIDIPGLYKAHGRYRYNKYGSNWRAMLAFLVSVVPNIPGMAATVNTDLAGSIGGADKIYDMFYFWGFTSAVVVYVGFSWMFPEEGTLVPVTISGDEGYVGREVGDVEKSEGEKGEAVFGSVEKTDNSV
ncbi:permease for cytosine/purines, uracil, thiamine, allantoin-domain-containing protein [Aspergillus pseudoustus]|uniref:Permease for cytosine/purines, uracil, thiamine, allantoin-domain-containing protein n=1 Tax=Aspergillus pseudoustus TaxID=1810923 RepID=A0ABR4K7U6_9EURO